MRSIREKAKRLPKSQRGLEALHQGTGREIIGGEEYDVEAGDLVFVPANVWHGSQNLSTDEPLRSFAVTQERRTPLAVQVPFKIRDDLRD